MKTIKNWFHRKPPRKKSEMFEKIERIEDTVIDIQALLYAQTEAAAQKPPQIQQAVPRSNEEDVAPFEEEGFEPLEPLEPIEEVSHDGE